MYTHEAAPPDNIQSNFPYLVHSHKIYRQRIHHAINVEACGGGEMLEPESGWDEHPAFGKNGSWRFLLGSVLLWCWRNYKPSQKQKHLVLYALSRAYPLYQFQRPDLEGLIQEPSETPTTGEDTQEASSGLDELFMDLAEPSKELDDSSLEAMSLLRLLLEQDDRNDIPISGDDTNAAAPVQIYWKFTKFLDVPIEALPTNPPRTDVLNSNARKAIKPELIKLLDELQHNRQQEADPIHALMRSFMPLVFFAWVTVNHKLKSCPDPGNRWEDIVSDYTQLWIDYVERALSCELRFADSQHSNLTLGLLEGINQDFDYFLSIGILEPNPVCDYVFIRKSAKKEFPDVQFQLRNHDPHKLLKQAITLFHHRITPHLKQIPTRSNTSTPPHTGRPS